MSNWSRPIGEQEGAEVDHPLLGLDVRLTLALEGRLGDPAGAAVEGVSADLDLSDVRHGRTEPERSRAERPFVVQSIALARAQRVDRCDGFEHLHRPDLVDQAELHHLVALGREEAAVRTGSGPGVGGVVASDLHGLGHIGTEAQQGVLVDHLAGAGARRLVVVADCIDPGRAQLRGEHVPGGCSDIRRLRQPDHADDGNRDQHDCGQPARRGRPGSHGPATDQRPSGISAVSTSSPPKAASCQTSRLPDSDGKPCWPPSGTRS